MDPQRLTRRDRMAIAAIETMRGGGEYPRTTCPFCPERTGTEDRRRNFWHHRATGYWGCWKCSIKGRLPGFGDDDSHKWLPEQGPDEEESQRVDPPEGYVPIIEDHPGIRRYQLYMKSRGVTRTIAIQAKIGAVLEGDHAGRVVVPVLGLNGETWVGWSARLIRDPGPWERKYHTADGMDRKHLIYNMRALVQQSDSPVLLMEGVFDALPYWPDATAFLGKPTDEQLDAFKYTKRPKVVCLDGDAHRECEVVARKLRRIGCDNVGWVRLPAKMDPNSVDRDHLREVAQEAAVSGSAEY